MQIKTFIFSTVILLSTFGVSCSTPSLRAGAHNSLTGETIIIAHRGLPGHLPEHTLEGYEKAIDIGADFIEPDLVPTKDGVLIARHENEISGTTDAAQKFPERKTTKQIDGKIIAGWFTEDFTLAEIKTLTAKERLPFRSQENNGKFQVPTLEEIIQLVLRKNTGRAHRVGIYPETKHPSYFRALNLALEPRLIEILGKYNLDDAESAPFPIFIQSFEPSSLKEMKEELDVPFVQLIDDEDVRPYDLVLSQDKRTFGDLIKDDGLQEIATYAKAIGPSKNEIVNETGHTTLVQRAHKVGLLVHPYTFRSDKEFLPKQYNGKPEREYFEFFDLGVDGLFSDFTDHAVAARKKWKSE